MKVKRIGFVGAHNAGKDTLTHHAFTWLKLHKHTAYYISEMAEQAIMHGMNLNTQAGQMWLLGQQIAEETAAISFGKREFVICNRTVIDAIAYASYFQETGQAEINVPPLDKIAHNYMLAYPYDLIVLLAPFAKLELDGVRMSDRNEQLEIARSVDFAVRYYSRHCKQTYVTIDSETKTERAADLETILELFLEKWRIEETSN